MKYEYWFANLQKISDKRKKELRKVLKAAEELYYIEETSLKHYGIDEKESQIILESIKTWNLEEEFRKLNEKNIRFVKFHDSGYPERLKPIPSSPYALYVFPYEPCSPPHMNPGRKKRSTLHTSLGSSHT